MSPFDFGRLLTGTGAFERLVRLGLSDTSSEGYTADYALWSILDKNRLGGFHFERNASISGHIAPYYCEATRLGVDLLHDHHEIRRREDEALDKRLANNRMKMLRFSDDEVLMNLDGVKNTILQELLERTNAQHRHRDSGVPINIKTGD